MFQWALIALGPVGWIAATGITLTLAVVAAKAAANSGSSSSSDRSSKEETLRNMKVNEEKKARNNEQQQMRRKIKEDFSQRLREINSHYDLDLPAPDFIEIKQYCDNPNVLIDLYMDKFECKSDDVDDEQKELEELKQLLTYTQGNNFKTS